MKVFEKKKKHCSLETGNKQSYPLCFEYQLNLVWFSPKCESFMDTKEPYKEESTHILICVGEFYL